MTQPSRVIYLPPGVAAVPQAAPVAVANGVPFDRGFFEQVLPQSIASFCQQVGCVVPVVELYTVDGVVHYVSGISGTSDSWVALHTARPEHDHPVQIFLPYQTIFRVEIHPAEDKARQHLGFIVPPGKPAEDGQVPAARTANRPAARKAATDKGSR